MSEKIDALTEKVRKIVAEGGGPMWEQALESLQEKGPERGKTALAVFENLVANNERKIPLLDQGKAPAGVNREEVEGYIAEFKEASRTVRAEFQIKDQNRGVWLHVGKEG